ncbi:MAG TPA: asparaginase [Firmicutes bacterium]|nr:asparaginase [Bacillota bacterium]
MPKIIVLSTGGTIGSAESGGSIGLSSGGGIIEKYCRKFNIDLSLFDCRSVINVLSENMQISDLQRLVDYLYDVLGALTSDSEKSEYSGIIITHGTDTLAFTANLLGIIFSHTKLPIIITGSNLPPDEENSDAFDNIKLCCDFINLGLPGVYAAFNGKIHIAARIGESRPFVHDYSSVIDVPFAVSDGSVRLIEHSCNPSADEIRRERPVIFKSPPVLGKIMLISPYVGLDYNSINIYNNCCDAVLHGVYHTGSVDSSGHAEYDNDLSKFSKSCNGALMKTGRGCDMSYGCESRNASKSFLSLSEGSIFSLAKRCADAKIPIFLGPVDDGKLYDGQDRVRSSGVITFSGLPFITAWAKLTAGINYFDNIDSLISFMNTDTFFERI